MANFFAKYLLFLTLFLTSVMAATNGSIIPNNSTSIITATSLATATITDSNGNSGDRPAEKTGSPDDVEGSASGVSVQDPGFILLTAGFAIMTFGMAALT
ncbi:hypothetical protein CC79DRAFT_1366363 [Sarocladium strictum]